MEESSASFDEDVALSPSPSRSQPETPRVLPTSGLLPGPLRVENVSVSRGGNRILNRVELILHAGEMCALIGPSGSGKSSLIRVLLGLWDPDEGAVHLGSLTPEELSQVGYVPQDDALHRGLTVEKELSYAAELRMSGSSAEERQARVAEVLNEVGLGDRARLRIRKLSGGQRKRVAVALELLTSPPLLILDEPTSGLDPGLEARTMELFSRVAATGHIVLVATHAMESIEKADALCVLVGGHVAFFGPPREALSFFRVDRYADLFHQLEKQAPSAWRIAANADPEQRMFLRRPAPAPRSPAGPAEGKREGRPRSADEALDRLRAEVKGEEDK
jgi:ABC-type multidrug transport system ATPase subunit